MMVKDLNELRNYIALYMPGAIISIDDLKTDLLSTMNGEGSCHCGEVRDYISLLWGFNPGPGLQPITPIPDGTRGYEYVVCSY